MAAAAATTSCASNSDSNLKEDLNKKNNAELKELNKCNEYFGQAQFRYNNDNYRYGGSDLKVLVDGKNNILRIETNPPTTFFPDGSCRYEKIGKLNKNYKFDVCASDFRLATFNCDSHRKNTPFTSIYTSFFEIEGERLVQYLKLKGEKNTYTHKLIKI